MLCTNIRQERLVLYQSASARIGMHAGLPWGRGMRPRAKSIRYQPVVRWPESQSFGGLVLRAPNTECPALNVRPTSRRLAVGGARMGPAGPITLVEPSLCRREVLGRVDVEKRVERVGRKRHMHQGKPRGPAVDPMQ